MKGGQNVISSKRRNLNNRGFTIIELLIVILVVGILILLVARTYSGIQARNRNDERTSDIKNLQVQLEAFFSQNGYYPSLHDMNSAQWRSTNMKKLDTSDMMDPSNTAKTPTLVSKPMAKFYAYDVTDSSGNSCESVDTNCAKYTLTATYESNVDGSNTDSTSNF